MGSTTTSDLHSPFSNQQVAPRLPLRGNRAKVAAGRKLRAETFAGEQSPSGDLETFESPFMRAFHAAPVDGQATLFNRMALWTPPLSSSKRDGGRSVWRSASDVKHAQRLPPLPSPAGGTATVAATAAVAAGGAAAAGGVGVGVGVAGASGAAAGASRSAPALSKQGSKLSSNAIPLVDEEAADSFGREKLGKALDMWPQLIFEAADSNDSGYLCPTEFNSVVEAFKGWLGNAAVGRLKATAIPMHFSAVDTSLEGRISAKEFRVWASAIEATLGQERCVRAACRVLGTRQAENRKKHRGVEWFSQYEWDPSHALLRACLMPGSPSLLESVFRALKAKADPNASLCDVHHNGYTPLICLAMTTPQTDGRLPSAAIEALIAAGADPFRSSSQMPFGKWAPLRFAAFMKNTEVLNTLLKHVNRSGSLGDLFLWAAAENVEHVMLEEIRKEYCHRPELASKVMGMSRFSLMASVMLQQYSSPIVGGKLTSLGALQLCAGEFVSGSLPPNSKADPNGSGLEGRTALMDVVCAGDVETTKALLRANADPMTQDSGGTTALHFAAEHLHVEVVKALLEAQADPSQVDHHGFSPWMLVGEEFSPARQAAAQAVRKDAPAVDPLVRRELLELLKPALSPEEIVEQLSQDWTSVLDEDFAGSEFTLEALSKRFRLQESLFFDMKMADGHGSHEGRMLRTPLLVALAQVIMKFLRIDDLHGKQKLLTRYLLAATMGPRMDRSWPHADNRASYRGQLQQVAKEMLSKFAGECNLIRQKIDFLASNVPASPCQRLRKMPADLVTIPASWLEQDHPDNLCWQAVQSNQLLRFDPSWALETDGNVTRTNLALIRLGAVQDLAECCRLQQVHHSPMAELLARGYIQYSALCNEPFQEKMKSVAERAARRHDVQVRPPSRLVATKKLKRLMEKIQEKKEELREHPTWPGRSESYYRHSQAFCILDTVRMSFTCQGDTTDDQVQCCMCLVDEFLSCTVEEDGLCVLRQKNGFANGVKGAGGYADVKLLIYADVGSFEAFDGTVIPLRIVGEVQLILDGYMLVKDKMHLVYELDRGSFDHKKAKDTPISRKGSHAVPRFRSEK
eukprot:CAMPEP_0206438606 /NCGR_PEP_ID=MMETSP0324_2-20121206/11732_1 /ASSEMBLY_ACC=CAM_ASM_000836 /TAXON_ID=2866 /ORGANISM="Crypthecodinium cohnii, Strain Seligo" /LENGTH=1084 /DNA_ID=CAMNT_0053906101 /DNA_START=51 /DNA_END=3305 /DNA_ORIENTATION=+